MNRFIALSAVLAVVAAEADPQLLYPALVSPHAKADALVEYPNGAKVPADTLSVQAARAAHLAAKPFAYGYPVVGHYLGKREAEAEADPDAWYGLYGGYHGFGYGYHHPLITSVGAFTTYANGAVVPTNTPAVQAATNAHLAAKASITAAHGLYHGYGHLGHLGYYGHYLGKRSADAEAEPWYGWYGHPAITSVGALTTYANGAVVPTDPANQAATAAHLAGKGLETGITGTAFHYLGKREAEADPDAWYGLYGGYHGFGYGYHHPLITSVGAFTTYANGAVVPTNTPAVQAATNAHLAAKAHITAAHGLYHGYGHLGYYGHYLGKRSADAEADPWFAAYYAPYPAVTSTAAEGQTTYSNGAVVPTHQANLDATAAHLATTYPRPAYLGYYYG
jgi:hypothetical protein